MIEENGKKIFDKYFFLLKIVMRIIGFFLEPIIDQPRSENRGNASDITNGELIQTNSTCCVEENFENQENTDKKRDPKRDQISNVTDETLNQANKSNSGGCCFQCVEACDDSADDATSWL